MNNRQERNEKGQSIIIVTLMIIVLVAMAGLSIDVGRLYTTRQALQGYTAGKGFAFNRCLTQRLRRLLEPLYRRAA